jgi:hypothetical protein
MVNLFFFPLEVKKLESPAMALEDPELVLGQSWKVVQMQETHVLLAS